MKRIGFLLNTKTIVIVFLALLCGACSGPMQYMRNQPAGTVYEKRTELENIQLFINQQPNDLYDSLGFIEWQYYQPGSRDPSVTDILPQLKLKASLEGGDALIVRSASSRSRKLSVIVEVIRFRR